jgi:hypothetical protein
LDRGRGPGSIATHPDQFDPERSRPGYRHLRNYVTVEETHMKKIFVIASLIAFSLPAMAQDTPTRVTPDALAWKENPAFPKGVQIATLVDDSTKGMWLSYGSSFRLTFKCRRTLTLIPRS